MEKLKKIEELIMIPLFLVGMSISLFGVFMRYIMNSPVIWVEEIFALTMVWAIFIGFSTALKDDHHIAVDILYTYLPKKVQRIFDLIGNVIGVLFSIFFVYNGTRMILEAYRIGGVTMDARLPLWIVSLIMPIGGALLLIAFLEKIYKLLVKKEEKKEGDEHGIFAG